MLVSLFTLCVSPSWITVKFEVRGEALESASMETHAGICLRVRVRVISDASGKGIKRLDARGVNDPFKQNY